MRLRFCALSALWHTVAMSWLRSWRQDPVSARLAAPTDRAVVAALLADTWRRHGGQALDDQAALLQSGLSAVAFTGATAVGFLGLAMRTPAGSPPETWVDVDLAAIGAEQPVDGTLRLLLERSAPALRAIDATALVCLTALAWLRDALIKAGFVEIDRVITLAHTNRQRRPAPVGGARLAPAGMADVETVLALNAAAFEPLWRYDDATVISWLLTADRAVLAYLDERPVGFALTTQGTNGNFAHLIRVATHPVAQGRGVGRQLVADAVRFTQGLNGPGLALNTQISNRIARHLYESLGFQPTGSDLAVLVLRL